MEQFHERRERIIGTWYAVVAFAAWGVLPLYWKILKTVPSTEILGHRIIWSFVFAAILVTWFERWDSLKTVLANRSGRWLAFLCSALISANWGIYIWAVNSNHIVEASLGYYINPLFNVLLGVVVLKERLNFWQLVSLLLALTGVTIMTVQYGNVPWIAFSLTLTFGLYGLVKKLANLDSVTGLASETLFATPVALAYLVFRHYRGIGSFGAGPHHITLLLILGGVVTALPLLWFAQGATRVPLTTIGFAQYLSPSISLFLGVLLFKEPFTMIHLLSFGFIWCALTVYSFSHMPVMQKMQPGYFKKSRQSSHVADFTDIDRN